MRPGLRRWVALAACVVAVVDVAVLAGVAGASHGEKRPLVKVSVWSNGKCGKFADSLPTLASRSEIGAGETVNDVVVCVTNDGRADGTLDLGVIERAEIDVACGADEPLYDDSCGGARLGELGPNLVQEIGLGKCAAPPAVAAQLERRFPALESPVVLSKRLRAGERLCTRMVLRYLPAEHPATAASQSDRTTWRYVFALR